jgi:hypothetical protein
MKYRPQRGSLDVSMAEVVEVSGMDELLAAMLRGMEGWYPLDHRPSRSNVTVEPYGFDDRIGWDTYLVCASGHAWGFTDGPLT